MSAIRHMIVHVVFLAACRASASAPLSNTRRSTRGVEGWVRNRRDGSVEAVFAGDAEMVAAMIETCRRGPLGARVDALHQREGTADDLKLRRPGEVFSVLPTA